MGGRVRPYKDPQVDGNIFNYFAIDFEYPGGVHVLSMCRQVDGSDANFKGVNGHSEALVGTKGICQVDAYRINGKRTVTNEQLEKAVDPYVQEHTDLIASIRAGKPLNELKNVAESTMTAITGRMAATPAASSPGTGAQLLRRADAGEPVGDSLPVARCRSRQVEAILNAWRGRRLAPSALRLILIPRWNSPAISKNFSVAEHRRAEDPAPRASAG
jgi:hypothetical protein